MSCFNFLIHITQKKQVTMVEINQPRGSILKAIRQGTYNSTRLKQHEGDRFANQLAISSAISHFFGQ
jgi:hypothetical protein